MARTGTPKAEVGFCVHLNGTGEPLEVFEQGSDVIPADAWRKGRGGAGKGWNTDQLGNRCNGLGDT